ncbi:hypothetical protein [Spiroplasma endosymbiont of Aleiodes alternator]|uniref:hypothetical protein n=1 Tax=Spiroplasma endosymbiont of Aleiodes alternator TaxID=3139329 RepID=UPI003CCAC98B
MNTFLKVFLTQRLQFCVYFILDVQFVLLINKVFKLFVLAVAKIVVELVLISFSYFKNSFLFFPNNFLFLRSEYILFFSNKFQIKIEQILI